MEILKRNHICKKKDSNCGVDPLLPATASTIRCSLRWMLFVYCHQSNPIQPLVLTNSLHSYSRGWLKRSHTLIANSSFSRGCFPYSWKRANITGIWKGKGSKTDTSKYRPISILPVLAKVIEKESARQLNPVLRDKADNSASTVRLHKEIKLRDCPTACHRRLDGSCVKGRHVRSTLHRSLEGIRYGFPQEAA
jgi:hypothetical protein